MSVIFSVNGVFNDKSIYVLYNSVTQNLKDGGYGGSVSWEQCKGYFPEDVAIRLLLPQKLKDQYVFKTQKALETLIFKEAVTEWND